MKQTDEFVAWKELSATKELDFITWVHPVTLACCAHFSGLQMTLQLSTFAKPTQKYPHSVI